MSEYHKIETLFERDEKTFKVKPEVLKNRTYSLLKTWHWTEKVDGTNIRCIWKDGKLTFGGKTDNAQIHADLIKWLYEHVTPETMRAAFPMMWMAKWSCMAKATARASRKAAVTTRPIKKLIVFDVLVGGKWWLNFENVCDVAAKLGLDVVPSFGEMPLEEAADIRA